MNDRLVPNQLARSYGLLIVVTEIALVALTAVQTGRISVPLTAIALIAALGGAMTAAGRIIGRVVFIPAALVQLPILLFAGLLGAIGVLAGYIGGQSSITAASALYAGVSVLATVIIILGILILAFGTRRAEAEVETAPPPKLG